MNSLATTDPVQHIDMLTILLGRLRQIEQIDEKGTVVEQEIQQIVHVALTEFISAKSNEVSEAALDILRYLPIRSGNEVNYILELAEDAQDEKVQKAYALAIKFSKIERGETWTTLENGRRSNVPEVRMAVEERLQRGNSDFIISDSR
jgi:hypothetical protein